MLLACADGIDIIGPNRFTAAFSALEKQSRRLGLTVNEHKTKYMVSTTKEAARMEASVSVDNFTFEVVNNFVLLGISVNTINNVSLKI